MPGQAIPARNGVEAEKRERWAKAGIDGLGKYTEDFGKSWMAVGIENIPEENLSDEWTEHILREQWERWPV